MAGLSGLLADPQTPLAHGASHQSGGGDAIKLDDLAAPDDNTDLDASTLKHGLMKKFPGGTSTFLRADATFAAPPGGGSLTVTTVEQDLGGPTFRGKFTITDAAISPTSKVLCWQAPGPYTGKGTLADEAEVQPVQVIAVAPASGSAVVYWQTPPYVTMIPGARAGGQPASTLVPGLKDPQAIFGGGLRRVGKVKGNVKFSYTVAA